MTAPDMFGTKPRSKPRVMMHVSDAGDEIARFYCKRCNHETGWTPVASITEGKRGMPCPNCNKETQ